MFDLCPSSNLKSIQDVLSQGLVLYKPRLESSSLSRSITLSRLIHGTACYTHFLSFIYCIVYYRRSNTRWVGGAVAQSVERATPGEEAVGSIPAVATCFLLFGLGSVKCDRLRQKSWSPHSVSCVAARKFVRRQSWIPSKI